MEAQAKWRVRLNPHGILAVNAIWLWWLIVCVVCAGPLGAAEPYTMQFANPLAQPWRITHFPELKGRGLRCVTEDRQGRMWFGLKSGATCYDGHTWTDHGLQDGLVGPVDSMVCDANGNLVAGTPHGVFVLEDSGWRLLFPERTAVPCPVTRVELIDKTIWCCSPWGLIRLGSSTKLFTSAGFREAAASQKFFDEISIIPDNCLPTSPFLQGCGVALAGSHVAQFAEESPARVAGLNLGDRVLVDADSSGPLHRLLDREEGHQLKLSVRTKRGDEVIRFTTTTIDARYRSPAMHSVMKDQQGRLWAGATGRPGSYSGRVLMSEDDGENWQTWTRTVGLNVGPYPTVKQTSDQKIHVLSLNHFSQFDGEQWHDTRLNLLSGLRYDSGIAETADGCVWVSGQNRVYLRRNGTWRMNDTRNTGLPSESHRFFVASDQSLWMIGFNQSAARVAISTDESCTLVNLKFHCLDSEGTRWFVDARNSRVVKAKDWRNCVSLGVEDNLMQTPSGIVSLPSGGVVIVGSHEGVASIATQKGDQWTRLEFPEVGQDMSSRALSVAPDGRVWAMTKGGLKEGQHGGILVGLGEDWEHLKPPEAPSTATFVIPMPDGRVMVGGGYGVLFYQDRKWTAARDKLLVDTPCTHADRDDSGNVWVATSTRGVLRYRNNQWSVYSTESGLLDDDVVTIEVDANGGVWANTLAGLCRFDGTRFYPVSGPHHLGRKSIRKGDRGCVWLDGQHRYVSESQAPSLVLDTTPLKLNSSETGLIEWDGADVWNRTASDELQWSHRIDDGPWSPFRPLRFATVRDLSPGRHYFQVRGRDADFNETAASDALPIIVLPVVWMRPWFLTAAFAVIVSMLWQAVGLWSRSRSLAHANQELNVAQERLAEQFAEKSAQFRAVCDCSPMGIFVTDIEGATTYCNPAMEDMLSMTLAEAQGHGWILAIHPDDRERVVKRWTEFAEGASALKLSTFNCSGRFRDKLGNITWFEVSVSPIELSDERMGYVGAVDDVTDRVYSTEVLQDTNAQLRQALAQLQHAQEQAIKRERLSALGQMAAGVAHDINNSLAPLLTYSELLSSDTQLHHQAREWVELIRLGVTDTAATVKRLEHFYRKTHNPDFFEVIDLRELAEQVVELTRPRWQDASRRDGKSIDVEVVSEGQPTIAGHGPQLRSVFTNLIFNAVDAIDSAGMITIHISQMDRYGVVEVRDSGAGMNEEELETCLEPFVTTKEMGSGLGLSECHGVVRQHGGRIEVESTLGQGTTVRVLLPVGDVSSSSHADPTDVVEEESPPSSDDMDLGRGEMIKVLMIDDDELVRASTRVLLEALGLDVTTATDGPAGLARLEDSTYHIVMCDQGLPGMEGLTVLKKIKERWPDLPVLLISGWSLPEIKEGVRPDAFLEKPFSLSVLCDTLRQLVPLPLGR